MSTQHATGLAVERSVTRYGEAAPSTERNDVCETCGNRYDKAFTVTMGESTHVFDSFECAIQALAPVCNHCGIRIIGHGVETHGIMYCSAHCASAQGVSEAADRV